MRIASIASLHVWQHAWQSDKRLVIYYCCATKVFLERPQHKAGIRRYSPHNIAIGQQSGGSRVTLEPYPLVQKTRKINEMADARMSQKKHALRRAFLLPGFSVYHVNSAPLSASGNAANASLASRFLAERACSFTFWPISVALIQSKRSFFTYLYLL